MFSEWILNESVIPEYVLINSKLASLYKCNSTWDFRIKTDCKKDLQRLCSWYSSSMFQGNGYFCTWRGESQDFSASHWVLSNYVLVDYSLSLQGIQDQCWEKAPLSSQNTCTERTYKLHGLLGAFISGYVSKYAGDLFKAAHASFFISSSYLNGWCEMFVS